MSDSPQRSSSGAGPRKAVIWGTCAAIGALAGTLAWPEPPARAAQPVRVHLAGAAVQPDADPEALAVAHAQHYLAGPIVLRAGDMELSLRRTDLGARVDLAHLEALLEASSDARSTLRRIHERALGQHPVTLPMPARLDDDSALPHLRALKDRIEQEASDAHVDPRKKQAVAARPGIALDIHGSLERIERALIDGAREVELATLETAPTRTIERFEDIDMGTVLSEFSTRYNRGRNAADRTHNLRVAAGKLDGYVLQPGEVFDFNRVVGDRTKQAGFKLAPVIAYGKLVDGMGGGTCQIASTLHAAAFFAGLPMLERHPHSRPSYYIKLGLDAAVAYGSLNFKFKNDRDYPVVLEMTVKDGFVRARMHGPERRHRISFLRRIDATKPFDQKMIEDEELPKGLRVLSQRGIPGFELTRLRVVHDERTRVATREKSLDKYPPPTEIWRIGTGEEPGPDFEHPPNDAHPEYVADEFMKATAGPGINGIEVTRKAGRTGEYGWTERENMRKQTAYQSSGSDTAATTAEGGDDTET